MGLGARTDLRLSRRDEVVRSLHLFAGIGGGIIADVIAGNEIVGAVEINPFCRAVLRARQAVGMLPTFPIYNDVREIKGDEFGRVDLVCGGFPCQDISLLHVGGRGLRGEKSGLFYELVRICDVCEPAFIFLENVPAIIVNGLRDVLATLTERGFDAEWTTLSARDCGAIHTRNRWWGLFASNADSYRQRFAADDSECSREAHCAELTGGVFRLSESWNRTDDVRYNRPGMGARTFEIDTHWFANEPYSSRVVNGAAVGLDDHKRIGACGNAQVPLCAYLAYEILMERMAIT